MILWHQLQFATWGHPELLDRSLSWYLKAEKNARKIAERQGFKGVRWMKMTDPDAGEAPSSTGSFLIWQQPHLIWQRCCTVPILRLPSCRNTADW